MIHSSTTITAVLDAAGADRFARRIAVAYVLAGLGISVLAGLGISVLAGLGISDAGLGGLIAAIRWG